MPLTGELALTFFDKVSGAAADSFYDGNGHLRVTKLFALAARLDDIASQPVVDGFHQRDVFSPRPPDNEPWYPPHAQFRERIGHHPRPRLSLRNAAADSGDDSEGDEDVFEEAPHDYVIDVNLVLGSLSKRHGFQDLRQYHQTRIIRSLLIWRWFPMNIIHKPLAEQKKLMALPEMKVQRWRTLFVGKRRLELTNPMAFSMFSITGTEEPHHLRKRSAAYIQYTYEEVTGRKATRFGRVLYFLSMVNGMDMDGTVQIAIVERYIVTEDISGHFLMITKDDFASPMLEVIKCRWIKEPIGLLWWSDGYYITWHNGSTFKW